MLCHWPADGFKLAMKFFFLVGRELPTLRLLGYCIARLTALEGGSIYLADIPMRGFDLSECAVSVVRGD